MTERIERQRRGKILSPAFRLGLGPPVGYVIAPWALGGEGWTRGTNPLRKQMDQSVLAFSRALEGSDDLQGQILTNE